MAGIAAELGFEDPSRIPPTMVALQVFNFLKYIVHSTGQESRTDLYSAHAIVMCHVDAFWRMTHLADGGGRYSKKFST